MTDVSRSLAVGFTKAVNSDDNFNITMRRIRDVFSKDAEDAEKLRRGYDEVVAAFPESATPDTPPVPPLAEDPIADAPTPTGDAPTPTGDDSSPTAERREGTPIPREVTHEVPVVRARTPDAVEGDDVERDVEIPAFIDPDILVYEPDPHLRQLVLVLDADARARLEGILAGDMSTAAEGTEDKINSLLATRLPSLDGLREANITLILHCLAHKAKAVIRTTKYTEAYKNMLSEDTRVWASIVAYGVCVGEFISISMWAIRLTACFLAAPFGKKDLHDPSPAALSPFVGPKDLNALLDFNKVVQEILVQRRIPWDMSSWPSDWRRVMRLRDFVPGERKDAREDVMVLELFAKDIRVLRTQVSRDQIDREAPVDSSNAAAPTAPAAEPTAPAAEPTPTAAEPGLQETLCERCSDSPATGGSGHPDLAETLNTEDATIEEEENFSREDIVFSVSKEAEGDRTQALQDEDSFAHLLFADDDDEGWTASVNPKGDTEAEGFILATLVQEASDTLQSKGTETFLNPFFFESTIWSKKKKKWLTVYPVASLHRYHARIAVATGPIARGLFPRMVHTSSHVESKFSLKRRNTRINASHGDYVRGLCQRGSNEEAALLDTDEEAFSTTDANFRRTKHTRVSKKPLVAETWKRGVTDDDRICKGRNVAQNKDCDNRGSTVCPFYMLCGMHCRHEDCSMHGPSNMAKAAKKKAGGGGRGGGSRGGRGRGGRGRGGGGRGR